MPLMQAAEPRSTAQEVPEGQQDAADQHSLIASPGSRPGQEHFGPRPLRAPTAQPMPQEFMHSHEMAYLAALRQFGISHPHALDVGLPSPAQGRLLDHLMPSGPDEQELATLRLAEHLQQQQMPSANNQPPTPRSMFPLQGSSATKVGKAADPRGQKPPLLQPSHAQTQPASQQRDGTEDRFPHNPALDPFLSSLQHCSAADQRAAAQHAHPQGASPAFEAQGYQETLRMHMDSPLYASNQAAAAAAAAAADAAAAAHMEGRSPYPLPFLQSKVPGSRHEPGDLPHGPAEDEHSYQWGSAERSQASSLQHPPHDHWPTRTHPRGPAEAAMQAALQAQLIQGVPADNGLQQAMQVVAMHADGNVGRYPQMVSEESHQEALLAGRPPFADPHLPPHPGSFKNPHALGRKAFSAGPQASTALQRGRGTHQEIDLQIPLPAEHPLESFIEHERSKAGIGPGPSEQKELDRLQRTAEWMGGRQSTVSAAVTGDERISEAHTDPMQAGMPRGSTTMSSIYQLEPKQCECRLRLYLPL